MKRNKKGQYIKGTNGNVFEGFGIWYDAKGYPMIWVNNKSIKIHIYVWERTNGEKPKGYDIHHVDFNKKNYDINNLELLSYSNHQKIHAGWKRDNKGEWVTKPCKDCKKDLPIDSFYQRKYLTPLNRCIKCSSVYSKKLRTDEFKAKKRVYLKEYYKKYKTTILQKQKDERKKNRA